MIRRISSRNAITIPKEILKRVGIEPGSFVEVSTNGKQIILMPKVLEDPFSEEEWDKLKQIANESGKIYSNANGAKKHIERLIS